MPAIFEKLGIAYFGIPKVMSTTLLNTLYELEHGRPFLEAEHDGQVAHDVFPQHPLKPGDFDLAEGYWCITVVRNPVERLISAYGNRVVREKDHLASRKRALTGLFKGLKLNPTPDQFFERLDGYQENSRSILYHTFNQTEFLGHDISKFDAVFQMEDSQALAVALTNQLGRQVELPHMRKEKKKLQLADLSDKAQATILDYTKPDYTLLQDYYAKPSQQVAA